MGQKSKREQALQSVVDQYRGQLTAVIRSLVQDQAEAEDVLQDVFEEYITAYDLGTAVEKLGAWLVTVARHKVLDRFRRGRTRSAYAAAPEPSPERVDGPDDEWERAWLRDEIAHALSLLPPEQRQVFVMYELEGKSFKEIAAATQVPIGTLLARKKYAVDFLREHLQEIFDEFD